MKQKILVAYASSYGSTQEIAEEIARTLRQEGQEIDLLPAKNVRDLNLYDAVFLGAPIYMFRWHKDAVRFINRFQRTLTNGLPIAIFAGGPFGSTNDEWDEVSKNFMQILSQFDWLKPLTVEIVGGRFDPNKLRLPYSLIPALHQTPAADLRDWDRIHAWASEVLELLNEKVLSGRMATG